ncbi:uncharacterized protein LOC110980549 isoform X2 [Acanthaster planci]|uniref:Uncharacterized protein LOC110980549 isoform X2 n=1 Tax=Acanthaster planci TaxID=133434 RepID=A0A8B7YKV6_ACAPL|nr:uncharacterized protein LOC110980549 isoform X2 [Acanthaster planci]XP_022093060.1 uncharacterized protein LOC110980549 isoform X2 [Acanthaster planci]
MVWSSIPWNWVVPLIVLLVLLLFSIGLACFCKFGRKKTPRHEDPKVMLHNIDSVEVISNPTCATVFVPAGEKVLGAVIEDDEVDLGLGTAAASQTKAPAASAKAKVSKDNLVADKEGAKDAAAGSPDAFTNPEADISLVAMDLRSGVCREYQNPVEMDHDVSETSESAPMIPSKKK